MKAVKGITVLIITLSLGLIVYGTAVAGNGRGMGQGPGAGVCLNPNNDGTGPGSGELNPEGDRNRFGGNGRFMGQGLQNGAGPLFDIFSGDPIDVVGAVADVGNYGQGIGVDTGTGIIRVFGIGPYRYWADNQVDRPAVGDEIFITGYEVTFSDGSSKIIATKVSVGDVEVLLRDLETGAPLWRGPAFAGRGFMHHNCPYADEYEEPEEDDDTFEME